MTRILSYLVLVRNPKRLGTHGSLARLQPGPLLHPRPSLGPLVARRPSHAARRTRHCQPRDRADRGGGSGGPEGSRYWEEGRTGEEGATLPWRWGRRKGDGAACGPRARVDCRVSRGGVLRWRVCRRLASVAERARRREDEKTGRREEDRRTRKLPKMLRVAIQFRSAIQIQALTRRRGAIGLLS